MAALGTGGPADPYAQQPGRWMQFQSGSLSIAYMVHHVFALFVLPAAFIVIAFGLGATLVDPTTAFVSWDWWRIYGVFFALFAVPAVEYWLGQERKVAFTSNSNQTSSYSRAQINVIYAIYVVGLLVLGAWTALLVIWLGVADFDNCAGSPLCSGPTFSSTPCTGAIMIITGMCVVAASLLIVLFPLSLYVHSASRDAFLSRMSLFFPLNSEIGVEMGATAAVPAITAAPGASSGASRPVGRVVDGVFVHTRTV